MASVDSARDTAPASASTSPYYPVQLTSVAMAYYDLYGGVEHLRVRRTASGNLVRFSFRVTDPVVASALGDKRATPYLYGQRSHALLQVPVMDKIGPLRQAGPLIGGREYWVVFSNKGDFIRAGDRVNVIIGSFHIDGLLVE
nr:hypothetical protein [Pandoraea terrae]